MSKAELTIFLSRITDANDYAWFMQTPSRLDAAIDEYATTMQQLINDQMPAVWASIQDEIDNWKTDNRLGGYPETMMMPDGTCMTGWDHDLSYGGY